MIRHSRESRNPYIVQWVSYRGGCCYSLSLPCRSLRASFPPFSLCAFCWPSLSRYPSLLPLNIITSPKAGRWCGIPIFAPRGYTRFPLYSPCPFQRFSSLFLFSFSTFSTGLCLKGPGRSGRWGFVFLCLPALLLLCLRLCLLLGGYLIISILL